MSINLKELAATLPKIRITSTPRGQAPDHIKQEWIGVEIPCLYFDAKGDTTLCTIENRQQVPSYVSYAVLQVHAIEALAKKSPETATWWQEMGFPEHDEAIFMFSAESVESLGTIPTQREVFAGLN